jgi:uncharacterized protein (TIGR03437 family)
MSKRQSDCTCQYRNYWCQVEVSMISLRKRAHFLGGLVIIGGLLDTAAAQNNSFQASPTQLVFNMPQAGVLPVQSSAQFNLTTTLAGSSVQFSTNTPSWLSVSPTTGTASPTATTITATLSGNAAGLASGSYTGAITVFQSGTGLTTIPSLTMPVTLNVGNQFTVSPSTTVSLSYQSGQTPPAVSLNVSSTVSAIPFTITNIQPSASWLQPSVAPNATTPGTVSVTINPTGLTAGNYSGTFNVSSSVSGVTVNLTVSESPTLSVNPQSLSFAYQTGTSNGALPGKTVTMLTNGGPVGFTVDPSPQSWLSFSANGTIASQTQPAVLTVLVNPNSPAALTAGTYTANITVHPIGAANSAALTIPVTLLVSNSPLLILGNAPNAFNYQIGGSVPADQTISIASSSATAPVDYTVTDKPAWLDVAPGSGTTGLVNSLTLHVNTSVLATLGAGTYQGTVTVKSTLAGNSPLTFPVTLNVNFTPSISTTVGGLTFNYQTTTGQQPGGQYFSVTSTGSPLPVNAPAFTSTTCGGSWLSVTTASTTTPATLFVTVNTTGITAPNTCTGTISIQSGSSTPLTVPVTLNVSANPLLNVTAPDLSFTTPLGSTTVQQKTIQVSSTDPATPLNYTVASDQSWLTANPASGNTGTSANFAMFVNPAIFIQPGTYTGNLTVTNTSANPAGSQPAQKLLVTVTVTSNVTLTLQPGSPLNLTIPLGSQATSQTVALSLSSGTAGFTATASSPQGWLKVSTTGGTPGTQVGGTAPSNIVVIADPTSVGLAQGSYTGMVTITSPGLQNSPVTLTVNLTVSAAQSLSLSPTSVSFALNAGATGNATQTFNVSSTGGAVNFTITKGSTGCDAISVSPASGTTGTTPVPITVTLNQTGLTAGTIACTLTVAGPQGSGIQSQPLIVNVNVGAVLVPQITALVNAASYAPGPVAPGEVVTIYGSNLGPTTLTTYILNPNNTFATTVADTQVMFDNIAAPILYVRNDQASVVVPFEIAGRPTTTITIKRSGQTSATLQMQVSNFVPGLFTINQQGFGQGAIINQNNSVNGQQNPAPKGSVVAIYLTSAGTFTSNVATGSVVTTATPVSGAVTITIGGQTAQVQYSGAAGTAIAGLYQFNAVVPSSIGSGPQPVVVTVGGQPAQSNVTVYVQ